MKIVALIHRPEVIKRILSHLERAASASTGRAPPSASAPVASAAEEGSSPTGPHYEPLLDDLPWEEPTFEDAQPLDDGQRTFEDPPPDDEPIGDSA